MGFMTYAPMVKTYEGTTLFLYDSCLTLEEAVRTFNFWEENYDYHIKEAWIDVMEDGKKSKTLKYRRGWVLYEEEEA